MVRRDLWLSIRSIPAGTVTIPTQAQSQKSILLIWQRFPIKPQPLNYGFIPSDNFGNIFSSDNIAEHRNMANSLPTADIVLRYERSS
jgi:hypothetical protein